eukprot:SM000225S07017  [mRNA]  locus=s225:39647:40227:+ [translate_table: standard]
MWQVDDSHCFEARARGGPASRQLACGETRPQIPRRRSACSGDCGGRAREGQAGSSRGIRLVSRKSQKAGVRLGPSWSNAITNGHAAMQLSACQTQRQLA